MRYLLALCGRFSSPVQFFRFPEVALFCENQVVCAGGHIILITCSITMYSVSDQRQECRSSEDGTQSYISKYPDSTFWLQRRPVLSETLRFEYSILPLTIFISSPWKIDTSSWDRNYQRFSLRKYVLHWLVRYICWTRALWRDYMRRLKRYAILQNTTSYERGSKFVNK